MTSLSRARCTRLTILLCCFALSACPQSRPFQPAPPLFELWAKPGVDQQGVRRALLNCGFINSAHIDDTLMTTDDYARGELCMLDKGFLYQGRYIVCAHGPEIPACADVPRGKSFGTAADFDPVLLDRRPRHPPAYDQWRKDGVAIDGVQQDMRACGYLSVTAPVDIMLLNDLAAAQLCMLDRGYYFKRPVNSLLCKNPPPLRACRGHFIDAQNCCEPPEVAGQH